MKKITRDSIFKIADGLEEKGEKITNEAVKKANGGRGSFTTIAPIIREWKALKQLDMSQSEKVEFAELVRTIQPFWNEMKNKMELTFIDKEEKYIRKIMELKEENERLKNKNK